MKIHEGGCIGRVCTRTHAYKCRLCGVWFRQEPYVTDLVIMAHPCYPYCSKQHVDDAFALDPGYHALYASRLALVDPHEQEKYPNPQYHSEFNHLLITTKEL